VPDLLRLRQFESTPLRNRALLSAVSGPAFLHNGVESRDAALELLVAELQGREECLLTASGVAPFRRPSWP